MHKVLAAFVITITLADTSKFEAVGKPQLSFLTFYIFLGIINEAKLHLSCHFPRLLLFCWTNQSAHYENAWFARKSYMIK